MSGQVVELQLCFVTIPQVEQDDMVLRVNAGGVGLLRKYVTLILTRIGGICRVHEQNTVEETIREDPGKKKKRLRLVGCYEI